MIERTITTWILIIFGAITFLPLFFAQTLALLRPKDKKTRDILIGKGKDWRDKTHFKSAKAFAFRLTRGAPDSSSNRYSMIFFFGSNGANSSNPSDLIAM